MSDTEVDTLKSENLRSTYRQFANCNDSTSCKLLLAVSGLAPPPGTDPCFDEMHSLLTFAVTGQDPSAGSTVARHCQESFPATGAQAEARLLDLLLQIAGRRFAPGCR